MIKRVHFERLRGLPTDNLAIEFKPGLNLLTGKNGSGKTTVMKAIWYLISGNIERATSETPFHRATLETDQYILKVECANGHAARISASGSVDFAYEQDIDDDGDFNPFEDIEEVANEALVGFGSSMYFPTFRRIEGGYGLDVKPSFPANRAKRTDVEESVNAIAARLSNEDHRFICSVSTSDISRLLLQKYAELSDNFNQKQAEVSQAVISQISQFESKPDPHLPNDSPARDVLYDVKKMIEELGADRDLTFQPISAIREKVESIFESKAISFSTRLSFGDAAKAVASDHLSAGEKQMLSFICYNALTENATVFIDEPELSLHPDWQRELFRVLEDRNSNNQFIIATHSPFIYSRYPECEIKIKSDRGDGRAIDG